MKEFDNFDKTKYIEVLHNKIVCYGGDGTLLKAIAKYRHLNLPFFGIAAGTINFLMNRESEILYLATTQKFSLLKVEVTYVLHDFETDHETIASSTHYAFNDIVLGNFNSWIHFDCKHNDDILGTFSGSGIIISTAQGSTGINKNNNGVILPLSSKDWSITGMQCNRNINYVLEPEKINISCNSRQEVKLAIDGNDTIIKNVKSIKVSKGTTVDVLFNDINLFKRKRQH